ncbi:hypothetical protein BKA81DRAFT_227569 [Phyllosticta paracitricarpa]|uniref:Uncharacterized protein n=1 Tax=Phyllosticta paracitricarpa TaxID=2016321 RepID=A0ABR1MS20_9PEZI
MLNTQSPNARPTADECLDQGCRIEMFKRVKTKAGETIIDIEDLSHNTPPTQVQRPDSVSHAARMPNMKSSANPGTLGTLSKERTVRAAQPSQVSNGPQIGSKNLSNSGDSLGSLFSDRTARAGQLQTSSIHTPKQTSQALSKRIDRSRSPLPVDGRERNDASPVPNPSSFTPRVTRAAAAAAERASHQPYPIPPVRSARGQSTPNAKSHEVLEKKTSGISRLLGRK